MKHLTRRAALALSLTLALLLTLAACGGDPEPQPAPETDPPDQEAANEPVREDPSLTQLRADMADRNAPWAIAFLGNLSQGQDVDDLLAQGDYLGEYPFLGEVDEEHTVTLEGKEVYCLVPEAGGSMTIYSISDLASSAYPPDESGYRGGDQPVILVCNVSDVISNAMVSVTRADGSQPEDCVFHPSLSLCDGSVALPGNSNAYDFSLAVPRSPASANVSFLGDWTATVDTDSGSVVCELSFQDREGLSFRVGYANSEWIDRYEGTYYVIGENSQYPAGSVLFEMASIVDSQATPFWGVFSLDTNGSGLKVTHVTGDPLLADLRGKAISFHAM